MAISGSIFALILGRLLFGDVLEVKPMIETRCGKIQKNKNKKKRAAGDQRPLGFMPTGKDLGMGKPVPRGTVGQ